jgi:hypothetical protein
MATDLAPAASFFTSTLPRLMALRADVFDRLSGTLSIGVHGVGDWTITFGDHRRPDAVRAESSLDADCVAVFTPAGFDALLAGRAERPVAMLGEPKLLARLGQLLQEPARGALGARLALPAAAR